MGILLKSHDRPRGASGAVMFSGAAPCSCRCAGPFAWSIRACSTAPPPNGRATSVEHWGTSLRVGLSDAFVCALAFSGATIRDYPPLWTLIWREDRLSHNPSQFSTAPSWPSHYLVRVYPTE